MDFSFPLGKILDNYHAAYMLYMKSLTLLYTLHRTDMVKV